MACIGCALLAAALAADQSWFDRHFLPSFWTDREDVVRNEQLIRLATFVAGAVIAFALRRPLARFFEREPLHLLTIALAVVAALGTTELVLRVRRGHAPREMPPPVEPLRHADARLGWLFDPSRTGHETWLGRDIAYSIDRNGYRVASPHSVVDFDAPAILFLGESMIAGEKLEFSETVPAQTSTMLGVQSANLAVSGFATDQMYLRLTTELPRFRRPVAVVLLFAPSLFDRNLRDARPHLGPGLVWLPPVRHSYIGAIAQRMTGYRSEDEIERGIALTREILIATVRLALSRGAVPLIVVPEFGPELSRERELRGRILDQLHLPYVLVPVDPDDRIEDDGHPDADGARTIAEAIATKLRGKLNGR